ncbi:neuronal pentraxin receptor-like isoform X2 [Penaeus japonicus]|uniref:neuronal pentraxin receptor-like isoform X2 n=1 Tax=Penaeus japonicus TaxID=27405 RepID=UPI001C710A59|nr:neuronal pentraxin receptor-like isoform X2 [Penaeus japonicus]
MKSVQQILFLGVIFTGCRESQLFSLASSCPAVRVSKALLNQTAANSQYIEYITDVPDLEAFTLSVWIKLLKTGAEVPLFTYVAKDAETHIKASLTEESKSQFLSLQINNLVIFNVEVHQELDTGNWHHVLFSWHGATGTWSAYLDGVLLKSGKDLTTQGLLVRGGGRAFSGYDLTTTQLDSKNDLSNHGDEARAGFSAWITLLFLDTSAIEHPDSWLNRLAVELVASKCMTEHGGDVIGWQDTPRRGFGGILEAAVQDLCQGRATP